VIDYVVRDGPGQYMIGSAMRVVELLVAEGPQSATKIAARIAVDQRTARRILHRLAHDGYLDCIPGPNFHGYPRYRLGPGARNLALRIVAATEDDAG
jgi:DNA-binding IclR family transcriptional regulator